MTDKTPISRTPGSLRRWLKGCAIALPVLLVGVTPARAADDMTLLLDWFVNPDHAPLIVASEMGYFDEVGLNVTMEAPADPNDPPKLVAAGKADLAVSYQPSLHLQVAEGLPLMRVGTLVATPLNTLIVLEDGPVKSLSDLKGKKVGHSVGGFEEALLQTLLKEGGLTLDDVEVVNVNFALSSSLLSGQVDAVVGGYRNFELNQLDIEGRPGKAFFVEAHGIPSYDELILLAHREMVADVQGRDKILRFLAALEKGTQYLVNHPEESWTLFVKANPDLDDELNRRAWKDTLPRFALRPAGHDQARYERFAEFLVKAGLIEKTLPVDSYAPMITRR